jgi:hypothetical protein
VIKTTGATLIMFVHMAALLSASMAISDDLPMLLFMAGAIMHRVADRRRRSDCRVEGCIHRDGAEK